uniref:Uncharacterized protein n=1 Tax=Anguilla anguilla TaxID=7936 RepID=A0A0E9RMA3_ANGAN
MRSPPLVRDVNTGSFAVGVVFYALHLPEMSLEISCALNGVLVSKFNKYFCAIGLNNNPNRC